jgi:hypothetical protein
MSFLVAPNSPKQTASSVNAPTVPTQVAGSSASSPTNGDNSTEQILQQISNLQDLENKKYNDLNALLASSNPTPDNIAQQKVLIGDITQLSNIRSDLFDTLLTHAQNNMKVNESMNANLQDKHTIITLKETDLKARKAAIAAINQKNENALKMVDINVYYKKQYEARVTIMKYVVLICFLVIFFVVLMNLGWLPQEFVTVLVVIIIFVGALYIGSLIYDMYQRSNINYDEYNWNFDSQKMNSRISDQPKKNKSVSTDRTCSSDDSISSKFDSMYKSVSSSAASLEDSMSSKATSFMNDVNGMGNGGSGSNPTPSSSSSSLPATSTSTVSTMMTGTAPSVQSNISESFMLSRVSKKYFSEPIMNDNNNNNKGINAFVIEDSYGRI